MINVRSDRPVRKSVTDASRLKNTQNTLNGRTTNGTVVPMAVTVRGKQKRKWPRTVAVRCLCVAPPDTPRSSRPLCSGDPACSWCCCRSCCRCGWLLMLVVVVVGGRLCNHRCLPRSAARRYSAHRRCGSQLEETPVYDPGCGRTF